MTDAAPERPLREEAILQVCLEAYGKVRQEGWLADRALEVSIRQAQQLFASERRAVAERTYALLRMQSRVDHVLSKGYPNFERLPASRQDALRFALSRRYSGETWRNATRGLRDDDVTELPKVRSFETMLEGVPEHSRFGLKYSLPQFLVDRFIATFGEEKAASVMEAMNVRGPLCIRTNLLHGDRDALAEKLANEGVESRPTPLSPMGLIIETRQNAFSLQTFKDGLFEIQDEGSQLLGMLVDAPPKKVVDACAGAGGKTLQLGAQMKNRGELFALDIEEKRLEDLRKRARRAGVHNARVRRIPAEGDEARAALSDLKGIADRVLVDAPCSGTGTFRRKPDARYRLTPDSIEMQVTRQRELLGRFSELVKPGGRIIYGTCSVLREENEDQIETFLSEHPHFERVPVSDKLGEELAEKVQKDGYLRLTPDSHGTDGFFGAILARKRS